MLVHCSRIACAYNELEINNLRTETAQNFLFFFLIYSFFFFSFFYGVINNNFYIYLVYAREFFSFRAFSF